MSTHASSKAKIKWQCRRGMLELDLILDRFISKHLDDLSAKQLLAFEHLLTYPDPELYLWVMGEAAPPDQELIDIVTLIKLQYPH